MSYEVIILFGLLYLLGIVVTFVGLVHFIIEDDENKLWGLFGILWPLVWVIFIILMIVFAFKVSYEHKDGLTRRLRAIYWETRAKIEKEENDTERTDRKVPELSSGNERPERGN